jgi:hypothetical protein
MERSINLNMEASPMPPPTPTITGSSRNNQIIGTSADDIIDALAGNDVVRAGNGDDVVLGNLGNDKLFGEDGADRLSGDQGNDDIDGGDGLDTAVYTGSSEQYQITTDANGVIEVKDLRSGRPDGVDHVTNTEFFDFADGTFQLQNGDLVPYEPPFSLIGHTIGYEYLVPAKNNVDFNPGPITVGSGIEVPRLNRDPFFSNLDIGESTLTFNTTISGLTFPVFDFNGIHISDINGELPPITGVNLVSTSIAGLTASDIEFDADNIYVNFSAVTLNTGVTQFEILFA